MKKGHKWTALAITMSVAVTVAGCNQNGKGEHAASLTDTLDNIESRYSAAKRATLVSQMIQESVSIHQLEDVSDNLLTIYFFTDDVKSKRATAIDKSTRNLKILGFILSMADYIFERDSIKINTLVVAFGYGSKAKKYQFDVQKLLDSLRHAQRRPLHDQFMEISNLTVSYPELGGGLGPDGVVLTYKDSSVQQQGGQNDPAADRAKRLCQFYSGAIWRRDASSRGYKITASVAPGPGRKPVIYRFPLKR